MKVVIGNKTYTEIRSLAFSPQVDVSLNTLPIGSFEVEIITTDSITDGNTAILYDDLDNLWAKYRISSVDHSDEKVAKITADNGLGLLDNTVLPDTGVYWDTIANVLGDVLSPLEATYGSPPYTIDPSITASFIGYLPEQTARERLQWLLLDMSAMIITMGVEKPHIAPVEGGSKNVKTIPIKDTYYKPRRTFQKETDTVSITAYHYEKANNRNDSGSEMVILDGSLHIVKPYRITLSKNIITLATDKNPTLIDGVKVMHDFSASNALTNLFPYYFSRSTVSGAVINNDEYAPGDWVNINMNDTEEAKGAIASASFSFGVQAKSDLEILETFSDQSEHRPYQMTTVFSFPGDSETSAIQFTSEQNTLRFPAGFAYSIENIFRHYYADGIRYVFRPVNKVISGMTPSAPTTKTIEYAKAVMLSNNVLTLISVSDWAGFFNFYTINGFSYNKDLDIQQDGSPVVFLSPVSYIKSKSISSGTTRWWPAEYVIAQGGSETSVDIAIPEGGVEHAFINVNRLRTPVKGGGWAEWIVWNEKTTENG